MNTEERFSKLILSTLTLAGILACQLFSPPTLVEPTSPAPTEPGVSIPTSPEEPAIVETEIPLEPVTIRLMQSKEKRIPAGTPVQLSVGWVAGTEEQVADFLGAVSITGTLDGQPLTDLNDYLGMIEPYEGEVEGLSEAYISTWLYPLGVLSPGTHTVEVLGTLNQPVTDGYDSNNDGQPDEYSGEVWNSTVRIEVEE